MDLLFNELLFSENEDEVISVLKKYNYWNIGDSSKDWKYFGDPMTGRGSKGASYGLPRFRQASFLARFPFGTVSLADAAVGLDVKITGWSPFIPGNSAQRLVLSDP